MSKTRCLELARGILEGRILAIDPSSGAIDRKTGDPSHAGWAVFDGASLTTSGVIEIPKAARKEVRFRSLLEILNTEFGEPNDVLVLEDIPASPRRGAFNTSQTLVQVCGVYVAGTSGKLVELASMTWQAIAKRIGGWTKGDESDAQYIGLAAIAFASGYSQSMTEKKKLEFLEALVIKHRGWNLPGILQHWGINE